MNGVQGKISCMSELGTQLAPNVEAHLIPSETIPPRIISYFDQSFIDSSGSVPRVFFGRKHNGKVEPVFVCDIMVSELTPIKHTIEGFVTSQDDFDMHIVLPSKNEISPLKDVPLVNALMVSRIDSSFEVFLGYFLIKGLLDGRARQALEKTPVKLPILPLAVLRSNLQAEFEFIKRLLQVL